MLDSECNTGARFLHEIDVIQTALKERGIDKMVEEAREDHKENDALHLTR